MQITVKNRLALTFLYFLSNIFVLTFFFDDTFIHIYSIFILIPVIGFYYKDYKYIYEIIFSRIYKISRLIFIAGFSLFLMFLYFNTIKYTANDSGWNIYYIIGYKLKNTDTVNSLLNELKFKHEDINSANIIKEYSSFKGEKSIIEIWEESGIIINRIIFIISHLILYSLLYFIIIYNMLLDQVIYLRILYLSNNNSSNPIEVDVEEKSIRIALKLSTFRNQIDMKTINAVTADDLVNSLENYKPHIVHFSVHGLTDNIQIRDDGYNDHLSITYDALKDLFKHYKDVVNLIVLNSCNSAEGAKKIHEVIQNTIGTNLKLPDEEAIKFSALFYENIGNNKTLKEAFEFSNKVMKIRVSSIETSKSIYDFFGIGKRKFFAYLIE